jgi:hypothetical protein
MPSTRLYNARKLAGLCVECGAVPPLAGLRRCDPCHAKFLAYQRRYNGYAPRRHGGPGHPATYVPMVQCGDCDGVGWVEGGPTIQTTCRTCHGQGAIPETVLEAPADAPRWPAWIRRGRERYGLPT